MNAVEIGRGDDLPPYSIRCAEMDPVAEANGHRHVVEVRTDDPDGGETRWTLVEVIAAIRDGERFMLGGDARGQAVAIEPTVCPRCHVTTLAVTYSDLERRFTPCR